MSPSESPVKVSEDLDGGCLRTEHGSVNGMRNLIGVTALGVLAACSSTTYRDGDTDIRGTGGNGAAGIGSLFGGADAGHMGGTSGYESAGAAGFGGENPGGTGSCSGSGGFGSVGGVDTGGIGGMTGGVGGVETGGTTGSGGILTGGTGGTETGGTGGTGGAATGGTGGVPFDCSNVSILVTPSSGSQIRVAKSVEPQEVPAASLDDIVEVPIPATAAFTDSSVQQYIQLLNVYRDQTVVGVQVNDPNAADGPNYSIKVEVAGHPNECKIMGYASTVIYGFAMSLEQFNGSLDMINRTTHASTYTALNMIDYDNAPGVFSGLLNGSPNSTVYWFWVESNN